MCSLNYLVIFHFLTASCPTSLHYNESDNASSANLSRLQVHRHQLTVSEMNSLSLFIDVLRVHATVELVE